jgi:hypothetical protein
LDGFFPQFITKRLTFWDVDNRKWIYFLLTPFLSLNHQLVYERMTAMATGGLISFLPATAGFTLNFLHALILRTLKIHGKLVPTKSTLFYLHLFRRVKPNERLSTYANKPKTV